MVRADAAMNIALRVRLLDYWRMVTELVDIGVNLTNRAFARDLADVAVDTTRAAEEFFGLGAN